MTDKRGVGSRWLGELSRFQVTKKSQLQSKSDQLYADVDFLNKSERRSTAVYLGGFVIELLLKAALRERRSEAAVAALLGRTHDLGELLSKCGEVESELFNPTNARIKGSFDLLANWGVRIRYDPRVPSAAEARDYWGRLTEVRKWLLGKI
jgi:hypothetical protein